MRFKRTNAEIAAGLSIEEAKVRRNGGERRVSKHSNGKFTIEITAAADVDPDYLEVVPKTQIQITLDNKWFAWFHTLSTNVFEEDNQKLLQFIMDHGIGTVLTKYRLSSDIPPEGRSV